MRSFWFALVVITLGPLACDLELPKELEDGLERGFGDDDDDDDGGSEACSICADCSSDADCVGEELCVPYDETRDICTADCDALGNCAGNAMCWELDFGDGVTYYACFSDNESDPCPEGWTC